MTIDMNHQLTNIIAAICLAILLSGAYPAVAAITNVDASPSSANVPLGQSTSIRLVWSNTTNIAGQVTVVSPQGNLVTPNGKVLLTVNKKLSRSANGDAPQIVRLKEALLIPTKVTYQAKKLGFNKILYQREFSDGSTANGEIVLYISSPKAASFAISRLALIFDEENPLRLVDKNETLTAKAKITFVGSGFLKGTWEISRATMNIADKNHFRPLQTVRQYLTGGDNATLISPPLPTNTTGPYLVRFRITTPQPAFDIPIIRYVTGGEKQ